MKYTVSLKENHIFRRLYRKGSTAADSRLAIYVRRNGRPGNRLGLTVSTKVGHAVVRNRLRPAACGRSTASTSTSWCGGWTWWWWPGCGPVPRITDSWRSPLCGCAAS